VKNTTKRFIALNSLLFTAIITIAFFANCKNDTDTPTQHTHDWGEWQVTTPPTCETEGVETRTCKTDATHTETRQVSALGHDWGNWVQTKDPTDTAEGEETRTCARCGKTETRATPKLEQPAERDFSITFDFSTTGFPDFVREVSVQDTRTNCGSATLEQITVKVGDEYKNIVEYLEISIMGAFSSGTGPQGAAMQIRFQNTLGYGESKIIISNNSDEVEDVVAVNHRTMIFNIEYLQDTPADIQQKIINTVTAMNGMSL